MALLGRSYTTPIVARGADGSAPAVVTSEALSTVEVVSAQPSYLPRAAVVMSSAPADIFFGGVTVASVPRSTPTVAPAMVLRGDPASALVDVSGPVPFAWVMNGVSARPLVAEPTILRGDSTSAPVDLSGPLAITLVETPPGRYSIGVARALVFKAAPPIAAGVAPTTLLPTTLTLDAHTADMTLAAHQTAMTLDPHVRDVTLNN